MNQQISNFLLLGTVFLIIILSSGLFFYKDIQQIIFGKQNIELPTHLEKESVELITVTDVSELVEVVELEEMTKVVEEVDVVKKESIVVPEIKNKTVSVSSQSQQSAPITEQVTQEPEFSFTKEKLTNLKVQLLEFCLVNKNLSEEDGKEKLLEIFNSTLGTNLDTNSSFGDIGGILLNPEVNEIFESIDDKTCVDKNTQVQDAVVSANYNFETDTLILSGSNFINKITENYSEISLNFFGDPSSVISTLKSEMIYEGVSDNLLDLDPVMNSFISASDTRVEIKEMASLFFCLDIIKNVPEFENSGNKLKVGVSFYKSHNDAPQKTPDVTFEIECKDIQKKMLNLQ